MRFLVVLLLAFGVLACDSSPPGGALGSPDARADAPADAGANAPADAGARMDASTSTSSRDAGVAPPPRVTANERYEIETSEDVYARGLTRQSWAAETGTPMDLPVDVYRPKDAPPNRPALVIVHGGGFTGGSRKQERLVEFARFFTSRGWVCISIDYRLARNRGSVPQAWGEFVVNNVPQERRNQALAMYPAARDTKAGIRWLYSKAAEFRINTNYVTVMGGSAGAALSIMAGVTNPEDFRDELTIEQDETLTSAHLDQPSDVVAILDYWGGPTHMTLLEGAYGHERFDQDDAPINIVHGTADPTVPFELAEEIRDEYIATGVDHAFHPLNGAGHGAWGASIDGKNLRENAFEFVTGRLGLTVD